MVDNLETYTSYKILTSLFAQVFLVPGQVWSICPLGTGEQVWQWWGYHTPPPHPGCRPDLSPYLGSPLHQPGVTWGIISGIIYCLIHGARIEGKAWRHVTSPGMVLLRPSGFCCLHYTWAVVPSWQWLLEHLNEAVLLTGSHISLLLYWS